MGRGHECEIRITDISVSRSHARVEKHGSNYFIFDSKSKFGTLVKEDDMHVEVGATLQQGIQIGRSVVILELGQQDSFKTKHSEKEPSETQNSRALHSRKHV